MQAETLGLAGDSTVATYSTNSAADKQGWGASFSKFVKNLKVNNYAKGGRTTKTFREEGHWKSLLKSKPNIAFVQFGHNDSSSDPQKKVSLNDYKSYLRKYVDEARAQKTEIYFVTSPRRCKFSNGKPTEELKPYVDAMKSVATEKDVGVLDLWKKSGDFLKATGSNACKTYYISGDQTHFNKKGSEKMASLVAEAAKSDPDLAQFMK